MIGRGARLGVLACVIYTKPGLSWNFIYLSASQFPNPAGSHGKRTGGDGDRREATGSDGKQPKPTGSTVDATMMT